MQKYSPDPTGAGGCGEGSSIRAPSRRSGCAVLNQQQEKKGINCGGGDCLGESIMGFTRRADAWVKGAGRSLYQSQLTEQVGGGWLIYGRARDIAVLRRKALCRCRP